MIDKFKNFNSNSPTLATTRSPGETASDGNGLVYVYRGVHASHPAVDAARRGIVFPGDINGSITPERHNLGGVSGKSPYTSWTYDYDEASGYATNYGGGGVILRAIMGIPPEGAGWYWVESPDEFGEQEILLLGE